ncbi:MAG: NAD(P)H-quinone oxidoreductase, partial [Deltaproteobacteria bacterium]
MPAIEIAHPGGPGVLRLVRRPVPRLQRGEVLLRVHAAGVNRPDILQRQGFYPPPPGASDLPGLEVAGEVVACAPEVTRWRVGDRVCALLSGGGYAGFVTVPALQCLAIPPGLDMIEAAALPETFFTVWHNLFERAHLEAGETCLVHGGSGGIGTTAIQLARAFGARVFTTAGTEEKCRACERLGAIRAVDYHREDFLEVLRPLTRDHGIDVFLDIVGADYLERNIELAAPDARI